MRRVSEQYHSQQEYNGMISDTIGIRAVRRKSMIRKLRHTDTFGFAAVENVALPTVCTGGSGACDALARLSDCGVSRHGVDVAVDTAYWIDRTQSMIVIHEPRLSSA